MICPNCGTRLPEGSMRCHFCGYEIHLRQENLRADTYIVIFTLAAVLLAVSILLFVVTGRLEIDPRIRAIICLIAGAFVTWVYWKISSWISARLSGSRP